MGSLPTAPLLCAICGAAAAGVVYRDSVAPFDNIFTLVRCARCGLIRTDPAPTEEALRDYYQAYAEHMAAAGRAVMSDAETLARAQTDVADLERFHRPGRLLDIGCGGGHLLRAAAQRGWQVFGTEMGEAVIAALRREFGCEHIQPADAGMRDLPGVPAEAANGRRVGESCSGGAAVAAANAVGPTWAGGTPAPPLPAAFRSFDAIVLRHVLEHLRDPGAMLRRARELLVPGGVLLCEVPDVNALRIRLRHRPLMGQLHLWHFGARSLRAFLGHCGFEVRGICFRDHRGPAVTPGRRAARRLRLALENAAWRLGVDIGANLRVYAASAT